VRLLTYARAREKRAGLLVEQQVYDIAACSTYFGMDEMPANALELLVRMKEQALRALSDHIMENRRRGEDLPLRCCIGLDEVRLCSPILRPPKIICLGRNYRDHVEEQDAEVPKKPLLFSKASTAVTDPGEAIVIPKGSTKVDFEGELAFVMGKTVKNPTDKEAEEAIFGYTCFNDVTEREAQFGEKQWFRGKSMDTFAPMGPWIVTSDEVGDPLDLRITTKVNADVMQSESTSMLIFTPVDIVVFAARTITLEPGDVLSTGTPGGVGVFRKPQVFLRPGDIVEVTIENIGTLSNPVEGERSS
jgi:2-keto-4-pentenoate hydratase/2-oxohepta-3-ene-1,7-dioic acid hydratase in catechol pathway